VKKRKGVKAILVDTFCFLFVDTLHFLLVNSYVKATIQQIVKCNAHTRVRNFLFFELGAMVIDERI